MQIHFPSKRVRLGHALITGWLFLAALAQLLYLAQWPMHLVGVRVEWLPGSLVALVRLGVYGALGWGMLERRRDAWAATTLELVRSLACFMVPVVFGDRSLTASAYPTAWAQGLLTAALPLVLLVDAGLAMGWRPPPGLEGWMTLGLRLWGASSLLTALWLRHHDEAFEIRKPGGWSGLFRHGLPLVLLVAGVEGGALIWSLVTARPLP